MFRKQESEPRRAKGKGEYQPKHAAPGPRRTGRDTTNLWLWLVLLVTSGFVAGTTAAFSATTTDTGNYFGLASLSPPDDMHLTIDGTNFDFDVETLGAYDGGSPGVNVGSRWRYYYPTGVDPTANAAIDCDGDAATYSGDLGESSNGVKSNVAQPGAAGRWTCIMAHTSYPTPAPAGPAAQWLSQKNNPAGAVQGGMVIQQVELNDFGGTAARLQKDDTIVVTFNQDVQDGVGNRPTSGKVCTRATPDIIVIGPADDNCNNAGSDTDEAALAYLEPNTAGAGAVTLGSSTSYNSTWSWDDGNTLTITLTTIASVNVTGCSATEASTVGCWRVQTERTVTTPTQIRSLATPQAALCATDDTDHDNGVCWPYATGRF